MRLSWMLSKRSRKKEEIKKVKFLVIKGKILFPGRHGLDYSVFDVVEFDPLQDLEKQKRKYTWRKLFEVDNKNPWKFKESVFPRQRHIENYLGDIITTITIFDHVDANIYYGFLAVDEIKCL